MKAKTRVSTVSSKSQLLKLVKSKIKKTPTLICPALNRRPVYLRKWISTNLGKNQRGALRRLQSFFVALEIIKKCEVSYPNPKNSHEWELEGETPCGNMVKVHIREEAEHGNRLLFHISNFHKSKKTTSR
ncbi:hypothetical protein KKF38_04270 [Patescibacteria group bacterium]|nr:hypothetical protein [Patescibacteria group bacterium]